MASIYNPLRHPLIFTSLSLFLSAFAILTAMLLTPEKSPLSSLLLLANLTTHVLPTASNPTSHPPLVTNPRTGVSYRGTATNGTEHFRNIFYAEDTAGANRFAAPVPYTPPRGTVVDATAAGAWCPQGVGAAPLPFTSVVTNVSENCLSLRIARVAGAGLGVGPGARLPVLVWLHGGGDILGSAYDQLYTPDGLVRQAALNGQPVVYVGINYRLGIFGYATSKALISRKQTNVGLRDQRTAFHWIRDNIAAFGGDPGNVVAIGQSVGAMAIGLHLVSYAGAQGVPFQKAMMLSGATGTNFNIMSNLVASNTATVARSVGCTEDEHSQEMIDCLRNVPLERLMNVSVALARHQRPPFGELAFLPSYDGDYIPDRPSVLLRKGAFAKGIPLIGSWSTNDGAWYAQPSITEDAEVLASFETFILGFSKASLQRILALYPLADFQRLVRPNESATAQYYRAAQMNRDLWFTCPVIDFTWQYARHGASKVRLFNTNQTKYGSIYQHIGVPQWRVSHLSEIPYIMNEDVASGGDNSAAQRALSTLVSGSAAAFAYTGDPNLSKGRVLYDWPLAYPDHSRQALSTAYPQKLTVYVVGGPFGSGPGTITSHSGSRDVSTLEKGLEWEKVIERCSFINSIQDEIGV